MTLFADSCFYVAPCIYSNGWELLSPRDAALAFLHGRRVRLVSAMDLNELLEGVK